MLLSKNQKTNTKSTLGYFQTTDKVNVGGHFFCKKSFKKQVKYGIIKV